MPTERNQKRKDRSNRSKLDAQLEQTVIDHVDKRFRRREDDLMKRFDGKVKDYKEELKSTVSKYGKLALLVLTVVGVGGICKAYKQGIDAVQKQISDRLDQQFQTEMIRILVEDKAKEYTEREAQKYISQRVNETITPIQEQMESAIATANLELQNINNLLLINAIADSAQYGPRKAYVNLKNIAAQQTDLSTVAKSKLIQIQQRLEYYRRVPSFAQSIVAITDTGEVFVHKFSLKEIISTMEDPTLSHEARLMCMFYVKARPKEQVFQKALTVLKSSNSLFTCAAFCGILSEISDDKAEFLDFKGWCEICQKELKTFSKNDLEPKN